MQILITFLHVLLCFAVIALVLVQRGKGSDIGSTFGGGASNTMFGSQGATPFLVKLTAALALCFFITSATLSFFLNQRHAAADSASLLSETPNSSIPVSSGIPASSGKESLLR